MDVGAVRPRHVEMPRLGAGRKQQAVIREAAAVRERDRAVRHVDFRRRRVEPEIDRMLAVEGRVAERNPALRRLAGKIVLRQVRAVTGRRAVGADHRQASGIALSSQHFGRGKAGGAATDDNNPLRLVRIGCADAGRRAFGIELFADEKPAVGSLDPPARQRIEGRRPQRLAGPQAETGMMPRTAYLGADQQPLGERAAIVRAFAADREDFALGPGQDHRILADMPSKHGVARKLAFGDPLREVGSARFAARFRHGFPPPMSSCR